MPHGEVVVLEFNKPAGGVNATDASQSNYWGAVQNPPIEEIVAQLYQAIEPPGAEQP